MQGVGFLLSGISAAVLTIFIVEKIRITGAILLIIALSPIYIIPALTVMKHDEEIFNKIIFFQAGIALTFLHQKAWNLTEQIKFKWVKNWIAEIYLASLFILTFIIFFIAFKAF
ncbi:hypothetical protein [Delftia lacustris]|uniref:hypothetical protein n=1 Tax=Delftia lacustris TaxID=558537 RepID=UPI001FCAA70E|nr:hypothetical protein [Delftia lacustris]BDE74070.1 hypothetical protein HQS1_51940 [Delftia lacustris]